MMIRIVLAFVAGMLLFVPRGTEAASSIDVTQPAQGAPYNAAPIRQNFQDAANDINALQSMNAGTTAPASPSLGTRWLDTSGTPYVLKIWSSAGSQWVAVAAFNNSTAQWIPPIGGGTIPSITSAATTDLGSVRQATVSVTGNQSIASFGSNVPVGQIKVVTFTGTPTIVYNATYMITSTGSNLSISAGQSAVAISLGGGAWRVQPFSGLSTSVSAVAGEVAFFTSATALGGDSNFTYSSGQLTVGDPTGGGYQPHNPSIPVAAIVSAIGAGNGFVGQVVNDVPFTTTPFLAVGVTGYGKVPASVASVAYGLYGLCEIYNVHGDCIGGEVTARNFSGSAASTGLPPPTGSPTTNLVANGWQVTCGTQAIGESDCSVGVYISNENGGSSAADPSWGAAGLFINAYRNYGAYIAEGYSTGSQIGMQIDNNGNNANLILKTTQAATPLNAVFEVIDNAAAVKASIYQNGDGHFNNLVLGSSIYLSPNSSYVALYSSGANALNLGPDAGWTSVVVGNGTADVFLNGTAKFGTYTNTPCVNAGYISIKDSGGTARKVQICG